LRFEEISERARAARGEGREVVLVLGLGFVGTAVVANLARTAKADSSKRDPRAFFVIGLDRDDPPGREKAASLDQGRSPTYADDPSLAQVIADAAVEPKSVVGTVDPRCIALADVVVSCINLDLVRAPGQTEVLSCPTDGYAVAMRMVGEHMRPGTLVCIESTLPLGMSDRVIYPALCEGQKKHGIDVAKDPPLLAFCYERVMPGPNYLDSVNNYWRAYAGIDGRSADRARDFLTKYVNVEKFPLWRHKTIRAAEMAKLLENSYRATNIAFIEEWARLAEDVGVDLFDVIHSVRMRKGTHDNMMFPGLGVGGYCLTKDALLAAYGAETLLGVDAKLPFSRRAILTNENMPLRTLELAKMHFENERAQWHVLVRQDREHAIAHARAREDALRERAGRLAARAHGGDPRRDVPRGRRRHPQLAGRNGRARAARGKSPRARLGPARLPLGGSPGGRGLSGGGRSRPGSRSRRDLPAGPRVPVVPPFPPRRDDGTGIDRRRSVEHDRRRRRRGAREEGRPPRGVRARRRARARGQVAHAPPRHRRRRSDRVRGGPRARVAR